MSKLSKFILSAMILAAVPLMPEMVRAQMTISPSPLKPVRSITDPLFLGRAQNLARQAAVKINGGLDEYRPVPSMFGRAEDAPYVKNRDGSVTFIIRGGKVGFTVPTQETIVTVAPNNSVFVSYNGPLRTSRVGGPTLPTESAGIGGDTFLVRAQNLARQAAVEVNGGLDVYRPEPSMFGQVENAPYVKNPNGSVTFTFTGSPPEASAPAVKSVVTVTRNDIVTVNYNGPIR